MNKTSIGFRISSIVVSLVMFIFLAGLVPVAIIAYKKGTKFHTATVQVQAAAGEVYSTALGIIYDDPDIELRKKDDKKLKVEGRKGKQQAKIEVKEVNQGKTELTVKADAGKKEADIELALHIAKRICDVMGVQYQVVEK
jgi:predicted sugar kinase